MLCMECGAKAEKGYSTSVTDLGNCLLIVRNVPCYKCMECNEVIYTGDVIKRLEQIIEQAKQFTQEISIVNYSSAAWEIEESYSERKESIFTKDKMSEIGFFFYKLQGSV